MSASYFIKTETWDKTDNIDTTNSKKQQILPWLLTLPAKTKTNKKIENKKKHLEEDISLQIDDWIYLQTDFHLIHDLVIRSTLSNSRPTKYRADHEYIYIYIYVYIYVCMYVSVVMTNSI